MKPLIGITTATIPMEEKAGATHRYGSSHTYVDAVRKAGAVPVLIPVATSPEATKEVFDRLDGVLFAGGNDLGPAIYDQEVTHSVDVDSPRDTHEVTLMRLTLAERKPLLAICRGMQLLNIIRGGSLYQDILKEVPGAKNHDGLLHDLSDPLIHDLSINPDTYLAKILGTTEIRSNSFHHQAVKDVGTGLVVSARTSDGIIEGLEDMSNSFVLGVQLHPESLAGNADPRWANLFDKFVEATSEFAKERSTKSSPSIMMNS